MIKHFCVAALIASASITMAQDAVSEPAMPEVQETREGQGRSGLMSGEKPFTLMVDDNVGELVYIFDEETKELESIHAKRGVIFASEDMTLNSDEMEYITVNSSLIATGKRVVVRMGDMIITCQVFKYNPETGEGEFKGTPIVYQRDREGKVTETAGRIISVINKDGKFQMNVVGGGGASTYVKSSPAQSRAGNLEKTTLAPGQTGASITLNNRPSALGTSPAAPGTERSGDSGSGGGILPAPSVSSGDSAANSTDSATTGQNVIDPDNADDVKKLTEEKN